MHPLGRLAECDAVVLGVSRAVLALKWAEPVRALEWAGSVQALKWAGPVQATPLSYSLYESVTWEAAVT